MSPAIAEVDAPSFDLDRAWCLHQQVAIRPESFGALAYHFGTRRLSFLKSPALRSVVESLGEFPSARAALVDAGIDDQQFAAYTAALQTLACSDMICLRDAT